MPLQCNIDSRGRAARLVYGLILLVGGVVMLFGWALRTGSAIAHCPTSNQFLGSGLFNLAQARESQRAVRVGLASDVGAGTTLSMLQTLNEAYKVAQLNGNSLSAGHAFYFATRGTAKALHLDDKIGSIGAGMEADLIVLDLKSTPLIEYRTRYCNDIHEVLFIQMTMADDRAIRATYVAGHVAHERGLIDRPSAI